MTTLVQPAAVEIAVEPVQQEQEASLLERLATPLRLGALQIAVCVVLIFVELLEPAPRTGFAGMAFSNAINSPGARAGLALFQDAFSWLPRVEPGAALSPSEYLFWRRSGIVALAVLQALALLGCLSATARRRPAPAWRWLVGPALASVVLLAYPPINTDVFYYAASARVAAIGDNPYLTAPLTISDDPFAPYNDWARITTPYGPVWTNLSRLVLAVTGDDPLRAALGFKVLAALAALGLGGVTIALARRLTGQTAPALAAGILVVWQPALLLESAGAAHLDATMMLFALAGLLLLATGKHGGTRTGLLLLAASVLVKPVTLPLLGLAALSRLWSRDSLLMVTRRWLADAAAMLVLVGAMFLPYWSGGDLPRELLGQSKLLYVDEPFGVNPFWYWVLPELPGIPEGDGWAELTDWSLRPATQIVTVLLLLATLAWLLRQFEGERRTGGEGESNSFLSPSPSLPLSPCLVRAWAVAAATLALIPVNAHAWYAIWAVGPIALAWALWAKDHPDRRLPWWLWLYLAWSLAAFLIYHTVVWHGETVV